jgi:hypothetical protein
MHRQLIAPRLHLAVMARYGGSYNLEYVVVRPSDRRPLFAQLTFLDGDGFVDDYKSGHGEFLVGFKLLAIPIVTLLSQF